MELSILEALAGYGVGGILAVIIFFMYRLDRKSSERRLTKLLEKDQESRDENTKATTELTILIRRLNGKLS
ncbi:hypothetical protein LCGC14_2717720 [marine sediment metagenome]|uniref:Uncharacterized protein n=1 Tax=marine sediment metagenome TaxID=412755 RepID=A0A0F8ZYN9_9ZZZZ